MLAEFDVNNNFQLVQAGTLDRDSMCTLSANVMSSCSDFTSKLGKTSN